MRFNKKYQRGIFLLFLLLIIISGIPIVNNISNNNIIDDNSLSMNAPEDPYEPNDDHLSAYDLRFNEANWLSSISGNGALWDDDWYMIELDPGEERLWVDLAFNHSAGNIDIEVYDWNAMYIDGSYSMDDNEHLEFDLYPDGIYYLHVYDSLGIYSQNSYDLWWEDMTPIDDQFEENDDFLNSRWIDPNYYSLRMDGYDEDWFHFYLNPGDYFEVNIYFWNGDGNLELELFDPYGSWQAGSYSLNDYESISATAYTSGDWKIRVYRITGSINIWYDLDLWFSVQDDWMEDNDDFYSASVVNPDYYSDLKMVDYDDDWYQIWLNSGDTIDIAINFDNSDGDLQLELFNPGYMHRDGSYTGNSYEHIMFTVEDSGEWRIHVYRDWGSGILTYDLDIKLQIEQPRDDSFEENDGFWSATPLTPMWYGDLRIVEDDEDWYQVYLNIDEIMAVSIHFDHYEGDLQLELYDPSYTKRAGSYSSSETHGWSKEHIMYMTDMSGEWRIRVYHETGDSDVYYELDIKIVEDFYEVNDDWEQAYNLKDDEYTWLSDLKGLAIQQYNDDWYRIVVSPGFEHLLINLKFNTSIGDLYMYIYQRYDEYSLDWNWIFYNNTMLGDDSIDIDVFVPRGDYFIQIFGSGSKIEYDLWWDDIRTDFRPDDDYEENDDPMTAYDLSFYEGTPLWHISGWALQYDDDWYRIQVYSGREQLFIEVYYDYQEGAIGVELYNWDYNRLVTNFTEKDMEFINYKVPSNGTYYIRIFGDRTGNVYSIEWHAESPEVEGMIPGYDIFILLGAIFGVATVVTIKIKRSKKNL